MGINLCVPGDSIELYSGGNVQENFWFLPENLLYAYLLHFGDFWTKFF